MNEPEGYWAGKFPPDFSFVTVDNATVFQSSDQINEALRLLKCNQGDLGYTFKETWDNGKT
jgi:hypothetical protein